MHNGVVSTGMKLVRQISGTRRLAMGLGVIALGVLGALPFRHAPPPEMTAAAVIESPATLGEGVSLQVPGQTAMAGFQTPGLQPLPDGRGNRRGCCRNGESRGVGDDLATSSLSRPISTSIPRRCSSPTGCRAQLFLWATVRHEHPRSLSNTRSMTVTLWNRWHSVTWVMPAGRKKYWKPIVPC